MAYIVGCDRNQVNMIMTIIDEIIDAENPVRVIDTYVESLDLLAFEFKEYSGNSKGQALYRRSDLLKLHIYGS